MVQAMECDEEEYRIVEDEDDCKKVRAACVILISKRICDSEEYRKAMEKRCHRRMSW